MTTTKQVIAEFEILFAHNHSWESENKIKRFITSKLELRTKEITEIGEKIAKEWIGAAEGTEALSDLIATLKSTYL